MRTQKPISLLRLEQKQLAGQKKPQLGPIFNLNGPMEIDAVEISKTRLIMEWHHLINQVSGGLVGSMKNRRLSRTEMKNWIINLKIIINQMEIELSK